MCTRISDELDDIACSAREALDHARVLAQRRLAAKARARAVTYWEVSALMQEYASVLYTIERIAKNKAGLAVAPWR